MTLRLFFRPYWVRTGKRDFIKVTDKMSGGFQPSGGFRDDLLLQLDCRPSLVRKNVKPFFVTLAIVFGMLSVHHMIPWALLKVAI
jgi:hypothetical protein